MGVLVVCLERYRVQRVGDLAVVVLPTEVDASIADLLRQDLIAAFDQGVAILIADMSATTFCDSTALGALIGVHKRAAAAGAELRLVITSAPVHRIMHLTGADQLISLYPTLAAARAAPSPTRPEPVAD
jgi:anti-sigma B factor antagonist